MHVGWHSLFLFSFEWPMPLFNGFVKVLVTRNILNFCVTCLNVISEILMQIQTQIDIQWLCFCRLELIRKLLRVTVLASDILSIRHQLLCEAWIKIVIYITVTFVSKQFACRLWFVVPLNKTTFCGVNKYQSCFK